MPSKNSVNKPKITAKHQRKAHLASKKRQLRAKQAVTVIQNASGSTEIVPISTGGGVLMNTVVSKKKAKKLERNLKYIKARQNVKKTVDVEMSEEDASKLKEKENIYRKALWAVVEDAKVNGLTFASPSGQGTTIGSATF